eukprot:gene41502-50645_t
MATTQVVLDLHSESDSEEEIDRPVVGHLTWKNQRFPLYEGENLLGREEVCEVTLDHPSVSSKHAEIVISGKQVLVRDLRSINGTFVEMQAGSGDYKKLSVRDNSRPIEHNSRIRLGMVSCTFAFSTDASSANDVKDASDETKDTNPSSSDTLAQVAPRFNLHFETQPLPPIGGNSSADDDSDVEGGKDDDALNVNAGAREEADQDDMTVDDDDFPPQAPVPRTVIAVTGILGAGVGLGVEMPTQIDDNHNNMAEDAEDEDSVSSELSQDLLAPIQEEMEAQAEVEAEATFPILRLPHPSSPAGPVDRQHTAASVGREGRDDTLVDTPSPAPAATPALVPTPSPYKSPAVFPTR